MALPFWLGNKGEYERLLMARPFKRHKGSCDDGNGARRNRYIDRIPKTLALETGILLHISRRRQKGKHIPGFLDCIYYCGWISIQTSSINIRESSRSSELLSQDFNLAATTPSKLLYTFSLSSEQFNSRGNRSRTSLVATEKLLI